ncbi:MAG: hypothetical protein LBQ39_09340, partial [Tannerellaceae bacterium]|nr:hypothetical protein [Tannerellaceae bacterium]
KDASLTGCRNSGGLFFLPSEAFLTECRSVNADHYKLSIFHHLVRHHGLVSPFRLSKKGWGSPFSSPPFSFYPTILAFFVNKNRKKKEKEMTTRRPPDDHRRPHMVIR